MIYFPNAKINLGLNIVSKRLDGYHNLETIFYPLEIKDGLEIIEKEGLKYDVFFQHGLQIEGNQDDNLVMRALRLMRQHYSFPFLEVHLLKKIPFGAGIGGGSADAAFMLRLINDQYELNVSKERLIELASTLGADCPFFIYNRPMYAEGIGERMEDIDISLKDYHIVLIKPDIFISTKDAFSKIIPAQPELNLRTIAKLSVEEWKGLMINDFEKSIAKSFPEIEEIKNKLYALGAIYASMSGSGSSVYGIFRNKIKENLNEIFSNCFVWEDN